MRKKFIAGAAVLALLMNSPQVSADDENIVVFGGEFEDEATPPKPRPVERPAPIRELPEPERRPEQPAPIRELPKPAEQPAPPARPEVVEPPTPPAQPAALPEEEEDDDLGDVLVFDDFKETPARPQVEPPETPAPIEPIENPTPLEPANEPKPIEPVVEPTPIETDKPFNLPTEISSGQGGADAPEPIVTTPPTQRVTEQRNPSRTQENSQQKKLKTLRQRFIKLAVDDTYAYYLDKTSVQWRRIPYSASEYMADVWIRMIKREETPLDGDMASYGEENFNAEIALAREQGNQYSSEDLQVLSHQSYVLEHYYLRPKTNQIQFLCELEVFGRPQNTINERAYDYKNWENLVPGSVESIIYQATMKIIGRSGASDKGHMTFIDMLEEYGRISLR